MSDDELTAAAAAARPISTRLDPAKSTFITIVGKKGHGKSEMARVHWESYPFDQAVLDYHHDFVGRYEDLARLSSPLPDRWPMADSWIAGEGERSRIGFVPDSGRPDYVDECDRFAGLAYLHGSEERPVMLWIDEIGELAPVHQTQPNMRRILQLGRHRRMTLLMCGPRPVNIDPLVLQQADVVYVFTLPNPADRRRVADTIGWDPREFDEAVHNLPMHGYLRYTAADQELVEFPPLPRELLSPRRQPENRPA